MHPPRSAPLRPLALGAAAILFLLGSVPAGAEPGQSDAPAASAAPTSSTSPADAAEPTELSEISYAGPDDADFREIAPPPSRTGSVRVDRGLPDPRGHPAERAASAHPAGRHRDR